MRIIVFGAGAVGSVLGGRLHQGGADVVLVARPTHANAIASAGLTVHNGEASEQIMVPAVSSVLELQPRADDIVLITAKTQDTGRIHDELAAWHPTVAIVCGTNGVEHERMALRRFERVYGMVIQLPATYETAGSVTALCAPTNALVDVGRYPSGIDEVSQELADTMAQSPHVLCEPDPHVMLKKYAKILLNLGNAAEAAIGLSGRGHAVVSAAQEEAKRIYKVAGIEWEIADEGERLRYADRVKTLGFVVREGTSFLGGSTWQSLAKGAQSVETDYFNGEIALLGRIHGEPTPHNAFLQRLAQELVSAAAKPASLTGDELDRRWNAWKAWTAST
jgi:2-dehydropantoate 2-reductase